MVSTVVILKGHKFDLWPSYNHVIMCFMIDFELDCLQAVLNWRSNFISVGGRYSQGRCHRHNKGPGCNIWCSPEIPNALSGSWVVHIRLP